MNSISVAFDATREESPKILFIFPLFSRYRRWEKEKGRNDLLGKVCEEARGFVSNNYVNVMLRRVLRLDIYHDTKMIIQCKSSYSLRVQYENYHKFLCNYIYPKYNYKNWCRLSHLIYIIFFCDNYRENYRCKIKSNKVFAYHTPRNI